MAVLKDLIVHGASRFLDKSFFTDIESDSISVTKLMAKGLTANDAIVVGLLDVQGELHTKSFSNSNIATIDGSFYITPTIGSDSGTVTIDATNRTMSFSGGSYAISSLYIDNENSPTWTSGSLVIITGSVKVNGEWIPLGTQKGVLGTVSSSSIAVNSLTDNKATATTSTVISLIGSQTSIPYKDLKISIYQWKKNSSTSLAPVGIYMTALSSAGRTFIDVYGGGNAVYGASDSYKGLAKPVVRIGNLTNCGLDAVGGIAPSGWGIYTQNGFFSGTVAAERGKIGTGTKVWTIGNDGDNRSYIYSGPTSVSGTTAGTYVGTDGFLNYASNTAYVKMTGGVITAVGAVIKGALTATSLTAGTKISSTSGDGFYVDGSGNIYVGNGSTNNFTVTAAGTLNATGATVSGAITASSLTISSGATISGDGASQILNSELEGAINAAKEVATNYITQIDNNGIWVTPTGKKPTNTSTGAGATGAKINADGMDIYKNGVSVAKYGDAARIGKEDSSRFLINESSLEGYNSSNVKYFEVSGDNLIYGDNVAASTGELNDVRDDLVNTQNSLNDKIDDYSATNDEKVDSLSDIVKGNSSSGMIGLVQRWSELDNYMEFGTYIEEGVTHPVLTLGKKETNELTARLRNDILEFVNGETTLAYLSGDALHVQEKVSFGNFEMYQRNTGHFSIRYTRGGDD